MVRQSVQSVAAMAGSDAVSNDCRANCKAPRLMAFASYSQYACNHTTNTLKIHAFSFQHQQSSVLLLMFSLFFTLFSISSRDLELRQLITVKLCHMIRSIYNFIIQVPKFKGPSPKCWSQKHAVFSVFGKKFRELWSTNNKDGHVSLDTPK